MLSAMGIHNVWLQTPHGQILDIAWARIQDASARLILRIYMFHLHLPTH